MRDFSDNLLRNHWVLLGRYQNVEAWRRKAAPGRKSTPQSHSDGRRITRGCVVTSEELKRIDSGRIPHASARPRWRSNQPAAGRREMSELTVSGVHEDVRIDMRSTTVPSMAW